ncbi:MAG: hypothetical protein ACM3O6_17190 [Acidobacteriota bacterium]
MTDENQTLYISRRGAMLVAAGLIPAAEAFAQGQDPRNLVPELKTLVREESILLLDLPSLLERVAFAGGTPKGEISENSAEYWMVDAVKSRFYSVVSLRKTAEGWRVRKLIFAFGLDDDVPFAGLAETLTRLYGDPVDLTMSDRSNRHLRWRASNRLIELGGDTPVAGPISNSLLYSLGIAELPAP